MKTRKLIFEKKNGLLPTFEQHILNEESKINGIDIEDVASDVMVYIPSTIIVTGKDGKDSIVKGEEGKKAVADALAKLKLPNGDSTVKKVISTLNRGLN
jgi:hypothetical protein